jgi:acetylglutamate kinase
VRILLKVGGAALEEAGPRLRFAECVFAATRVGHEVIVVHGGGNQIARLCERLELEETRVDGLRVTDGPTAEAVLMTLGGSVNRELVAALQHAGLTAVGLTGADGNLFAAEPLRAPSGVKLGYVGQVAHVDPSVPEALLREGHVPVIASVAPRRGRPEEPFYNINADHAVAPLAEALGADAVLFLTDVPAVRDGDGEPLSELDPQLVEQLKQSGALAGGMLPKTEAALAAARALPGGLVKIAPAHAPDCVRFALHDGVGTRFTSLSEPTSITSRR